MIRKLSEHFLFDSRHLDGDLARKSVQGGMTVLGAEGLRFALRLVGTMVLARLLTPFDYGLIGMVMVVVNFAQMFKDAGLSMATVQKDRITAEQISALFWLNVLISGLLGVGVLVCSPLVSMFYGRPELTAVTAVLSLSFLMEGLAIQHQALLRRHVQFHRLAIITVASQLVGMLITIALALLGWRHWALVGGSLTHALASTLLTFYLCPWMPGRFRRGTGIRDMIGFGGNLTGFNIATYFSHNADNLLIGNFLGADALGIYTRAYHLFMMPVTQIRNPLCQVAMPVLSSLRSQPERYANYYQRVLDCMASCTIPMALYCLLDGDFLIRVFLGSQWTAVVPVFRILAVAGIVRAIAGTRGLVLMSSGFSRRLLYFGAFNSVLNVASFAVGIPFGIEGVASAYAVANYAILLPSLFYCFHRTPVRVSMFVKTLLPPALSSVAAGLAFLGVTQLLQNDGIAAHCVSVSLYGAIYMTLSCLRPQVRETVGLFVKTVASAWPAKIGLGLREAAAVPKAIVK